MGQGSYLLKDIDGKTRVADLTDPHHHLTYPGKREFRPAPVQPAQPDTEPLIDLDPCEGGASKHSDHATTEPPHHPWMFKTKWADLRQDPNYLEVLEPHIQEIRDSKMYKELLASPVYKNASPGIRLLWDEVLLMYASMMSNEAPPGCVPDIFHSIELIQDILIRSRQYSLSPNAKEEVQKWIRKMLARGFIKPTDSPHRSPLLVVERQHP